MSEEYYNKEPVVNWKCVVFTIMLAVGYTTATAVAAQ